MNEVTISTTGRIFIDGDIKQLKRYHEYLEMKNSWIEEQEQLASIKEPNTRLPEPPFSTNILLHQNTLKLVSLPNFSSEYSCCQCNEEVRHIYKALV